MGPQGSPTRARHSDPPRPAFARHHVIRNLHGTERTHRNLRSLCPLYKAHGAIVNLLPARPGVALSRGLSSKTGFCRESGPSLLDSRPADRYRVSRGPSPRDARPAAAIDMNHARQRMSAVFRTATLWPVCRSTRRHVDRAGILREKIWPNTAGESPLCPAGPRPALNPLTTK